MAIGTALFLIAVGAILRFAVEPDSQVGSTSIDWNAVGVILMIIGAVGAAISLLWWSNTPWRRTTAVTEQRVVDPNTRVVERREYPQP